MHVQIDVQERMRLHRNSANFENNRNFPSIPCAPPLMYLSNREEGWGLAFAFPPSRKPIVGGNIFVYVTIGRGGADGSG